MAPSSSRNGARVIWVTIHTAEGIRNADDLKAFFDRSTSASSHAVADDAKLIENCVPYDRAAWTLRNGNPISDNLELCGFASWSRDEWLVNHQGMVRHAGEWIRSRCLARGIPIVKLTPADVGARKAGVIGHVDYTQGTGDGTHWDPGPGFPWDVVMAIARGEEDMTPEEHNLLAALHEALISGFNWPGHKDNQVYKVLGDVATRAVTAANDAGSKADAVGSKVDALTAKVDNLAVGGVDVNALAAALAPVVTKTVADELARRLEN